MITGFAVVANQMKIRVPRAHTALEMVRLRYGATAHIVFIFLMFVNSVIGVSMVSEVIGFTVTNRVDQRPCTGIARSFGQHHCHHRSSSRRLSLPVALWSRS